MKPGQEKGRLGLAGRSREVLGRGQETVCFTQSRILLWEPQWGGRTDDGTFHGRPKPWPQSTLVRGSQQVVSSVAEHRAALGRVRTRDTERGRGPSSISAIIR